MSFFSSFAVAFCGACVFIGAIYMLCPDGAVSKSVKYVLGLVFLLSVISAAAIAAGKWELNLPDITSDYTESEELQISAAEYVYGYALRKSGIDFSKITVCTDKSKNGSISINKVIICSDCEKSRILAALSEVAENTEVEVVND